MLVAAFEVDVGGPMQVGPLAAGEHGAVGRAGIEPDVEDVGFLAELSAAAMRAGKAFGQKLGGVALEPDIGVGLAN